MSKHLNRILVLDVEAICSSSRYTEIISVGLTEVDLMKLKIMESNVIYVKPTTMRICDRTTRLTGLTSDFIDENGIAFKEVCEILRDKFITDKKSIFGWGNFDYDIFCEQSKEEDIKNPINKNYYNLQNLIGLRSAMWGGNNSSLGLKEALDLFKMEFEGTPHCAKADSFNTAKLALRIFEEIKSGAKK